MRRSQRGRCVSLLATTSLGCVNTINKAVTVFPVPLADFTLTDACQDAVFNFINSSSVSTGTLTYDWDFGDMQTSAAVNPSKNYSSSGLFPVLLKATSDKGCVNSKTKVLDVWPLPILDFGSVINTCGTSYTLDALNSGSTYLWSDGTIGQTLLAQSNGTYSVQITTVNNCLLRESGKTLAFGWGAAEYPVGASWTNRVHAGARTCRRQPTTPTCLNGLAVLLQTVTSGYIFCYMHARTGSDLSGLPHRRSAKRFCPRFWSDRCHLR